MGRIYDLRREYVKDKLEISDLNRSPFAQFDTWFNNAEVCGIPDFSAMTLATVDSSGRPSARIVLLKDYSPEGFVFFTNYHSKKGKHIENNQFGAVLFYWQLLERQVRIEGKIVKTSSKISDKYFNSRPKGSRIGTWSSPQSEVLKSRKEFEKINEKYKLEFANRIVPRPKYWGGYQLIPDLFEFWQGRESRLHDRFEYNLTDGNRWEIKRLAP